MRKNLFNDLFCITFFLSVLFCSCGNQKNSVSFEAMNTFMTVQSYGNKSVKANKEVEAAIFQLEQKLSTTKEGSFIYKINHSEGQFVECDEETSDLINFAINMAKKTDGNLNICLYPVIKLWGFTTGDYKVPSQYEINEKLIHTDYKKVRSNGNKSFCVENGMEMDLGAVGKGYAGDCAVKILKENGVSSAILDLGGNIQTVGKKPDGSLWTIGIKNPWGGSAALGVRIDEKAVITSGGYERFFTGEDGKKYIHIFDGKTGCPVENDIASVTIVCESGVYGDALSTSMFVCGSKNAIDYWKNNRDFEMIIIKNNKELIYTSGLKQNLFTNYDFSKISVIE